MVEVRWYHSKCDDAELSVELDQPTYDDGDIIHVRVRLVVLRPLAIHCMKAALICNEYIEWCDSDASSFNIHTLVNEETPLLSVNQRGQTFEPREYEFHAKFVLPPGLPRLHYFRRLCVGETEPYVVCYLWVPNKLNKPKLDAGQPFKLKEHSTPWSPSGQTHYAVTGESGLHLLGIRVGGSCRMALTMDRPGIKIDGRTTASITIDSPKPRAKIKHVKLVLLEQAYFPLGLQSYTVGDSLRNKTRNVKAAVWDILPDDLTECDVPHDRSKTPDGSTPAYRLQWEKSLTMSPSSVYEPMQLHLITISYRMALYVTFSGGKMAQVEFDTIQLLRD